MDTGQITGGNTLDRDAGDSSRRFRRLLNECTASELARYGEAVIVSLLQRSRHHFGTYRGIRSVVTGSDGGFCNSGLRG